MRRGRQGEVRRHIGNRGIRRGEPRGKQLRGLGEKQGNRKRRSTSVKVFSVFSGKSARAGRGERGKGNEKRQGRKDGFPTREKTPRDSIDRSEGKSCLAGAIHHSQEASQVLH